MASRLRHPEREAARQARLAPAVAAFSFVSGERARRLDALVADASALRLTMADLSDPCFTVVEDGRWWRVLNWNGDESGGYVSLERAVANVASLHDAVGRR